MFRCFRSLRSRSQEFASGDAMIFRRNGQSAAQINTVMEVQLLAEFLTVNSLARTGGLI